MRDSRHRSILAGGVATGLLLTAAASAGALVDPVNKNRSGLALKGYDPVAYFKHDKPVKGSAQITHEWVGATWRFASAENRDAFAANPAQYAPQFGGYCSWAVSQGYTADIDPEAWKILLASPMPDSADLPSAYASTLSEVEWSSQSSSYSEWQFSRHLLPVVPSGLFPARPSVRIGKSLPSPTSRTSSPIRSQHRAEPIS